MDVEGSRQGIFAPTQTDATYLHQSGVAIYNADKRSRKDVGFTLAYVLLAAVTVIWGIVGFAHTDPNGKYYTIDFYSRSTSCDIREYRKVHPSSAESDLSDDATFTRSFNKAIAIFLPISACLAVVSSVAYLILFRRFAKATVYASIALSVILTLVLGIVSFVMGSVAMGVILVIFAVIAGVFYWFIRRHLAMCAELMALSARALYENAALVPTAVCIKVLGAGILLYGFAAFICTVQIGDVKESSFTRALTESTEVRFCYDANGVRTPCCEFQIKSWAAAYCFFCAVFIAWTTMLILEVKLYTVADTLSQWYFSAPALGANGSAALGMAAGGSNLARGCVRQAVRHCLTTSFGSVAFASAILAIIDFIRQVLSNAARNNIVCCIINCIAQPILALMQKFTRFATIATAITGEGFITAARAVFDTLTRNFLRTYTLWWVPDRVLGFTVFLISLSWGGVVIGATYGMTKNKDGDTKWGVPVVVGILSFVMMAYVLNFVAGLLLDAVNTLYICYAFDKDQRRVTHPEVHSMFAQVPGLAVENPDGNIMYGAPDPQQNKPQSSTPQPYPLQPYQHQPYQQQPYQQQPYQQQPYPQQPYQQQPYQQQPYQQQPYQQQPYSVPPAQYSIV